MMKTLIVFAVLAMAAFGATAPAGELEVLIQKNQNALRGKVLEYQKFQIRAPNLPAARLWVQKRSAAQDPVVERIKAQVAALDLQGGPVEFKPVQLVQSGPTVSQLRFFKTADRQRAREFANALRTQVPGLTVRDMTAQFAKVSWLNAGHFELWLALDLQ